MSLLNEEIERILGEVRRIAAVQKKYTGFCIGNTRKDSATGLYFSPIRNTARLVAGSVIVYSVAQASMIARHLDGVVDYVLVDTEKKISPELYGEDDKGNVERAVRESVKTSKILTYKGNDLTVDCIEGLVVQLLSTYPRGLGGKRAAIIGAGNIGSKVALKLVERGMEVTMARRNESKLSAIVTAINYIKPKETIAVVSGTTNNSAAATGANLLIGLTDGVPVITAAMIQSLAPNAVVIDGGKGCFLREALDYAENHGISVYRADIRPGFEGHVGAALETERIVTQALGRREINGVRIVSGGLLARTHEVVVDNVNDPRFVFGLADGSGDFIRNPSFSERNDIQRIQNYINERGFK